MPKYRKKPVIIDAIQWRGSWSDITDWLCKFNVSGMAFEPGEKPPICRDNEHGLVIETQRATIRVNPFDFIIREDDGKFYPCRPEIFFATYEFVKENDDG